LVLKLRDIAKSGPTVPILHEMLKMRGIDSGNSRSPLIEIDAATKEKVRMGLKTLSLI
jgi:dihydrodipicolinate synthase/N-acetylneuraminate lyase